MYHVKDSYPEAPARYVHPGTWKATAVWFWYIILSKNSFSDFRTFFLSLTAYLLLKANVALDKNLQHFKTALTFLQTLLVQLVGMATTVVWNAVATVLMIIPVFIRTEVA